VRLAGQGPLSRLLQRRCRLSRELRRSDPVELGEQRDRLVQMIGTDLEQLLPGPLSEPGGEMRMVLRTCRLRESRVRDLPDQDVLEAVRLLAGDRGTRLLE